MLLGSKSHAVKTVHPVGFGRNAVIAEALGSVITQIEQAERQFLRAVLGIGWYHRRLRTELRESGSRAWRP